MKRLITLLALMLMLLSIAGGAVFSAETYNPDDHTWGGEWSGDPGQYRHTNCEPELLFTGILPIDILINDGISYKKLKSLFGDESRQVDLYQSRDDRVVYSDRKRQVSLK